MGSQLKWFSRGCLLVATGLFLIGTGGARAGKDPLSSIKDSKPLKPEKNADPLRKLQIERYNAALREYQFLVKSSFSLGIRRFDPRPTAQAAQHLLEASLDLSRSPEERVKVYERHLELAKILERAAKSAIDRGVATTGADLDFARYIRADAEIKLLRAKQKAAPSKK